MSKNKINEGARGAGQHPQKKKRKGNVISFILCLLIAVAIWLYASSVQEKKAEEENTPSATALSAETVSNSGADIL